MSSPIGDGKGTLDGCLGLIFLAVLSALLVLVVLAVGVTFLGRAINPAEPKPAPSTSTRSTP